MVKELLRIGGVPLPMLLLRKQLATPQPKVRRRRLRCDYPSLRGDYKRYLRKIANEAVMAQQAIEAAFRSKEVSWRDVEVYVHTLHRGDWGKLFAVAQMHGVDALAEGNFTWKEAA
jgi:hypothetical protein